jgi:histidinol-phosphate/aromatic aminotransferase/cobyric acid decarboxylase-like protein
VSETIAERERLAEGLRAIGFAPLPSYTNFVLVPHERAQELYEALLGQGLAVRPSAGAIRITVHRPDANGRLLEVLAALS